MSKITKKKQTEDTISKQNNLDFFDRLYSLSKEDTIELPEIETIELNINDLPELDQMTGTLQNIDFNSLNITENEPVLEAVNDVFEHTDEQTPEQTSEASPVLEEASCEACSVPEQQALDIQPISNETSDEKIFEEDHTEIASQTEKLPDPSEKNQTEIESSEETSEPIQASATDEAVMIAFGLDSQTDASDATISQASNPPADFNMIHHEENMTDHENSASQKESPKKNLAFESEYMDVSQNKEVFVSLKTQYNFAKIRLFVAGIFVLLLGVLENVPFVKDLFGSFTLLATVDWILTVLAAILIFDRLRDAIKSLFCLEVDCDTVALLVFIFSAAATGTSLLLASEQDVVRLCNFPFTICVFLSLFRALMLLRRDIYSFKVISSEETKTVLAGVIPGQAPIQERAVFAEFLEAGERVCAVKKADFISSFFSHRNEKAYSKSLLKIFLPECLIFSILFFMASYFVLDQSFVQSMNTAYLSFLMSAPFTTFIAYSYPLYRASSYAYSHRCAIIGDKTHENYEKTSVIAMRDDDVFSSEHTKIVDMQLYIESEFDHIMSYTAAIYENIGGPLAAVFHRMTVKFPHPEQVELTDVTYDGVCALIDGRKVMLGTSAYMRDRKIMVDHNPLQPYNPKSSERILYLAFDGAPAARFQVEYHVDSRFAKLADRLAKAGVAVSVRTADPCIDDGILLYYGINTEEFVSVRTVSAVLPEKKARRHSAKRGGVVSIGSVRDLVKTFMVCEKIADVRKINFILKTIASVLGIAVMALLLFTGNMQYMISVIPAIYQLIWFLPIVLISKFKI